VWFGDRLTFLAEAIEALKAVLMPGAVCYFFMDWRHMAELLALPVRGFGRETPPRTEQTIPTMSRTSSPTPNLRCFPPPRSGRMAPLNLRPTSRAPPPTKYRQTGA